MAITRVNGALLRRMVINGAINLKNNYQEIDQLNVFPVPDGDTGTNMQMTMMSGVKEIENIDVKSMSLVGKTLSRGLLMGARGNSGVIVSQFFRGIYMALKNVTAGSITLKEFSGCLTSGYQTAYKAVMEPVEGTILTVVREAATKLEEKIDEITDLESLLTYYLSEARASLARTPELLPVLKEAGVVDSGGAGFIKIVEGMLLAAQGKKLTIKKENQDKNFEQADIKYTYCAEFIVELKDPSKFEEGELREILVNKGDSLALVCEKSVLKFQINTNNPDAVLGIALSYGEVLSSKVVNLRKDAPVIEKVEEKAIPVEKKKYAILSVCFGEGIKQTFMELGCDYIVDGGQTMNPATENFVKTIEGCNAENVIIIPNNSNVILAAEQASSLISGVNIRVLKAKTIAQGYASLFVFDPNADLDTNFEAMTEAIGHVKSGEVTYAVRDTEINGIKIASGDFMGISRTGIVCSVPSRYEATTTLLNSLIDDESEVVTIFYGVEADPEEVSKLEEYIESIRRDIEIVIVEGKQEIYSYIIAVE